MARLRFTREEAQQEATRLATAFVQGQRQLPPLRWISTTAAHEEPKREASKHPVVWNVMFALIPPPGATIDGGELDIVVDLETKSAAIRPAV